MGWDEANNRLLGANLNNGQVHVMDQNGGWIKSIGGAPKTRMQAAYEAIEAIVNDSLTSGVDFDLLTGLLEHLVLIGGMETIK